MWWSVALHPLCPKRLLVRDRCWFLDHVQLLLLHPSSRASFISSLSQTCTTTQASQHEKSVCHFFMLQLLGNSNCKKRLWLAGCCYPSTNFKFIHLSSIDICWFSGVHDCQFFSKYFAFIIQLQKVVAGQKWLESANNNLNLFSSQSAVFY